MADQNEDEFMVDGYPTPSEEEMKRVLKQALREWLDEKFASFGRWSFYGIMAAALFGLAYLAFVGWGFHR